MAPEMAGRASERTENVFREPQTLLGSRLEAMVTIAAGREFEIESNALHHLARMTEDPAEELSL